MDEYESIIHNSNKRIIHVVNNENDGKYVPLNKVRYGNEDGDDIKDDFEEFHKKHEVPVNKTVYENTYLQD